MGATNAMSTPILKCWLEQRPDGGNPTVRFTRSDCGYKTILSLDGGAMRCMVTVMLLQKLETRIKKQLKKNNYKVFKSADPDSEEEPEFFKERDPDDFDIFLGDCFDYVAGVSMGAPIAAYLAAYGEGSDAIFKNTALRNGIEHECQEIAAGRGSEMLSVDADQDDATKTTGQDAANPSGDESERSPGPEKQNQSTKTTWKGLAKQRYRPSKDPVTGQTPVPLSDDEFMSKVKKLLPKGSMKRLEAAFCFCTSEMFPKGSILDNSEVTPRSLQSRLFALQHDGHDKFMKLMFDDATARDLKQTLMVLSYDVTENEPIAFIADRRVNDGVKEVEVKTLPIDNETLKSKNGLCVGHLSETTSLRDLTKASAAIPKGFDRVQISTKPENGKCRQLDLIDGAIASNDPTLLATIFHPDPELNEKHVAILSIGSGLCTNYIGEHLNDKKCTENGTCSNDMMYYLLAVESSSRLTSGIVESCIFKYDKPSSGRYSRIQFSPKQKHVMALEDMLNCSCINDLRTFGKVIVKVKAQQIGNFVKSYVFGIPEQNPGKN